MPRHVVVDGSNIATEGRAMPSLRQLNDAVLAFLEEHPQDIITVVVDATFGHRIDNREVPEFDAAVENNELVSPPAGAIGRGDAFVLSIANKAKATILSNDSFQEFHAEFPWLFDEGRLIGGKPVPNVGWVFVARSPVRGPVSRRATRESKKGREKKAAPSRPSKAASLPMPVPKSPPPSKRAAKVAAAATAAADGGAPGAPDNAPAPAKKAEAPSGSKQAAINELLPFLDFVERHPVGSLVEATIESYSSHGAYASSGPVKCYLPLRYLAHPAPRSARDVVALGEQRAFVVVSFSPARRGVDIAVPGLQPSSVVLVPAGQSAKAAPRSRKRASKQAPAVEVAATEPEAPKKATRKRAPAKQPAPDLSALEAQPTRATGGREAAAPAPPAKRRAAKATTAPEVPAPPERADVAPVKATRARKRAGASTSVAEPAKAPAKATTKRGSKKAAAEAAVPEPEPAKKARGSRKASTPA